MQLSKLLLLAASTTAFVLPATRTATPSLVARDTTTTPAPTAAPSIINFETTIFNVIPGQTDAYVTRAGQTIAIVLPTCSHTITPDKNGYVPPGTCGALYDYYPSFAAAVVFAFIFGILSVTHIVLAAKFKTKFAWVLIMGALWETFSFTFRSISTKHQQNSGLELMSSLFVLLAPLWINAFAYMVLGRLIYFFHPDRRILGLPASSLAFAFVALDFVSFIVQLVGGSYAGPTSPTAQVMLGIHIYMGGIGLQQFFIFVFLGLAIKFHLEMRAYQRGALLSSDTKGWMKLLWVTYASLGFITIRIFFRLIQFSAGKDASTNALISHESYFYVLEAMPMVFALSCFIFVHPGLVLPEGGKMPGLWGKMRAKCCCGRARRRVKDQSLQSAHSLEEMKFDVKPLN